MLARTKIKWNLAESDLPTIAVERRQSTTAATTLTTATSVTEFDDDDDNNNNNVNVNVNDNKTTIVWRATRTRRASPAQQDELFAQLKLVRLSEHEKLLQNETAYDE